MKRCLWMLCLLAALGTGCGNSGARLAAGQANIAAGATETLDEGAEAAAAPVKYLALTFDDGPRRGTTDVLLDGLLKRGAAATFFVVGEQIEGNEDLIGRMAAEGHQIGNHTYSHTRLLDAAQETVLEEIQKTEVLLEQVTGDDVYWLRPPYGLIDVQRAALVGTPMIYWSVDPEDWKVLDAGAVVGSVLEQVTESGGDIILLHDFYPSSVEAALRLVDILQGKGYIFVTVEELFRQQGIVPELGRLYAAPGRIRQLS